ncbi:MAG: UbiA family prenyltransferase [Planctomycetota bacterium]
MPNRWWTYQAERFPLHAHGPLIAAFSFCAVSYSSASRGEGAPHYASVGVAFVTSLIFFLQLRIADEFKDAHEDAQHRPYRPVPRGLVSLRALGVVFAIGAVVQLGLALWLDPRLTPLLLVTWAYLALMSKEFFVGGWLKHKPVLYLVSHMAIMPLVDLYATGCDWRVRGDGPPSGLGWFLMASYFNGIVIEIGRKMRSPADEEAGVSTYSALWGRPRAIAVWGSAVALTLVCAMLAASRFGPVVFAVVTGVLGCTAAMLWAVGRAFARSDKSGAGKRIETASGFWTLALYLSLGLVPLALHAGAGQP